MIVKKASDLAFQQRCLLQMTDGTRAVEEFPLKLGGDGIPLHDHRCPQAPQNQLLFLDEGGMVVAILPAPNRPIDIDHHPFFVFGKRRVGLLEIAEFTRFVRRTRCVDEERSELGCFARYCSAVDIRRALSVAARSTIARLALGDSRINGPRLHRPACLTFQRVELRRAPVRVRFDLNKNHDPVASGTRHSENRSGRPVQICQVLIPHVLSLRTTAMGTRPRRCCQLES
jgi:hypothetical protein